MSNVVTLSDLLARSVRIDTFDAVAVVRAVSDRLLESAGNARGVPELHQIELSVDGQINITGAPRLGEPVRRLGQLLQVLLAQSEPPVQLRLVISQATAPESAYESIAAYSEALAYFERPDRVGIIRALYARAASASEAVHPGAAPTLDAMAPLPEADRAPGTPERPGAPSGRRRLKLVGAVAVLLTACIAGVYARSHGLGLAQGPGMQPSQVSATVVKASDVLGSALVAGVSAVAERAGLGRLVRSNEASTGSAKSEKGLPTRNPGAARKRIVAHHASTPSIVAFDLDWSPVEEGVVGSSGRNAIAVTETAIVVGQTSTPDSQIYSPGFEGVSPPVGLRPQLPRQLPDDVRRDDLARIEMTILEDGTVESVKLLGKRHTVHDAMMLSAAKAWEFQPALKDGHPVKYRKTVWMAVQ
jgi:hypothetical protein